MLMAQPGAIGYVLINFDGIPVMHYPEDLPEVQYSALVIDLVMKTKSTLKQLNPPKTPKPQNPKTPCLLVVGEWVCELPFIETIERINSNHGR